MGLSGEEKAGLCQSALGKRSLSVGPFLICMLPCPADPTSSPDLLVRMLSGVGAPACGHACGACQLHRVATQHRRLWPRPLPGLTTPEIPTQHLWAGVLAV